MFDNVKKACDLILKNKDAKALNYAVNYTIYAKELIERGSTDRKEMRIQCLYILNNITHWRGDDAKTARGLLREFVK